jgi:hypothetical protein
MPLINVSTGELLDKWSILEIKFSKFTSQEKISIISHEMTQLRHDVFQLLESYELKIQYENLKRVNLQIWDGMDSLYTFDKNLKDDFIALTDEITELNMQRAHIKRAIDLLTSSQIMETKSFIDE